MGKTFRQDAKYSSNKYGKARSKQEQIKKFKTKRGNQISKEDRINHVEHFDQEDKKGHKI